MLKRTVLNDEDIEKIKGLLSEKGTDFEIWVREPLEDFFEPAYEKLSWTYVQSTAIPLEVPYLKNRFEQRGLHVKVIMVCVKEDKKHEAA